MSYDLGSSDSEAKECLLLDRGEQVLYAAPVRSARRFLTEQHPPLPELTPEEFSALQDRLEDLSREWREEHVEVSQADIARAMREEQEAIEAIVKFLDGDRN